VTTWCCPSGSGAAAEGGAELLRVSKAEMELKRMYIERQETYDNLRPYRELLE
jgi:hypothetical protein